MLIRPVLIAVLLSLLPAAVQAAAAPPSYDLAACIRAALKHSPDLAAAAADLAGARARLDEARAGRYGEISYTQIFGLANQAHGTVNNPRGSNSAYFDGLGPFTRLNLEVNVPLWTFGKLSAAFAAAENGIASQAAHDEQTRGEVVLHTKQIYYALLLSRQITGLLGDMVERMNTAVEKVQKRLDAGDSDVTEIDLLKLKVARARFSAGALKVETAARLAQRALARAIGLPVAAAFEVAARRLKPVKSRVASLDVYLERGLRQRPEWRRLEAGVAAQKARVAMEEANYYPDIFLSTGIQFARAGNRTEQDNPFAYDEFNFIRPIGILGLRWDLNFAMTGAHLAQARADLNRLRVRQKEARSGLEVELRRAYAEVERLRKTLRATDDGRKAGKALLFLSVSNFDLGIGEARDLFEGLGAYTEASTEYFRAVSAYNMAVATLGKIVGEELTPLRY